MALLMMYPDSNAEQKIKDYQKSIHENGIYSHCFTFDIGPHITVGGFDIELETLKMYCAKTKRINIRFGHIGMFNHNNPAVFLAPDVTEELLGLYKDLHKTFYDCFDGDYYWVDKWIPHVTVNEYPDDTVPHDVRLDVIFKSTEYLMKNFQPFEAFISLGFADNYPERFELAL
ncbi:MAG: 2'-5' RNA ligase family protein [Oscillospiraceae bacterium]|nr:2'-5' RNA ligase family protein [Oscillospiraceae bacterium]